MGEGGNDGGGVAAWCRHIGEHPYHFYVLVMVTLVYLLNQLDRYLYGVVKIPFVNYHGTQYGLIAGPYFTIIYTSAGVLIASIGGGKAAYRKWLLVAALIVWSAATAYTALATKFGEVALARILQGFGEAGCTPFATAIIADYFPKAVLGTAISFYNIGIYTGYGLSLGIGSIFQHIFGKEHWQYGYVIFGAVGVVVAVIVGLTVRVKQESRARSLRVSVPDESQRSASTARLSVSELVRYWLFSPTLILLCFGGGIRNAGGYVWASYTPVFFRYRGVPDELFAAYMLWIPLVAGSLGAMFGGIVSDRLVKRKDKNGNKLGPRGRLLVIIVSNLLAAPFAAGALLLPAPTSADQFPWAFLSLIPANIIGEMWIGVTLTIVMESVPSHLKAVSVAIYLFIITNIGGNAPILVSVLMEKSGFNIRNALLIMYPGVYALASAFFAIVGLSVGRDMERARRLSADGGFARLLDSDGDENALDDPVTYHKGEAHDERAPSFEVTA